MHTALAPSIGSSARAKPLESLPEPQLTPAATVRYHELDALRAFAMLLGIFWHAAVIADKLPETASGPSDFAVDLFVGTSHAFRLPVFFVMAGFFAALVIGRAGSASFMRARLRRIGIPFAVSVVVLVPVINALTVWSSYAVWGEQPRGITVHDLLTPQPHHLWFLEYLLVFYGLIVVGRTAVRRLGGSARTGVFAWIATSRLRLLLLVPPLAAIWAAHALWLDQGVDASFIPSPAGVVYYGSFFLFGHALYTRRELIPAVRAGYRAYTLLPALAALVLTQTHGVVAAIATVTVAWSALFALMGWFAIWFNKPSARVRYVADAAYWLYLAHFPLVALLYVELTRYGVPLPIKLIGIPVLVIAGLLVVYQRAIRYTAVGRILHGPRTRPA